MALGVGRRREHHHVGAGQRLLQLCGGDHAIDRLVTAGHNRILLNLGDVSYVDSCGIGLLIAKLVSVRRTGGDVRLVNLTSRSHHLLEITRLLDVFLVFTAEPDAVASFSPPGV